MSFRLSDVNGIHHYAAFKPFLAAIPKSNRTRDAVEDAAVDFMRKYEAKYGMPMTPTIFEAFCHNIMTEIFQHKLWPVAAKKTAAKSMATIEDLQAKYDTMMTVSWGDDKYMPQAELDSDNEYIYDQPTQMVATANPWAVSEADALNGFTVPDLTLRKGIWESFPVILKPVDDCDGTARYAIEWHWDRLDASFMAEGASRNLDAMEWEDILRMRLFHSLATYSNKYTVEAARDDQQICVIAMVHGMRAAAAAAASETTAVATPSAVRHGVRRALDILKMAPVSWDRDGAKHTVKLHNKKCKELGLSEAAVKTDLMAQLATCSDCVMTNSAVKGVLCVVTIL
jgi:hypothetical protein